MAEQKSVRSAMDATDGREQLYSVGEVCDLVGTTRKTLFYYDRIGLLKPTQREGIQNYKQYDGSRIARLRQILKYREAGLHIAEIRELLDERPSERLEVLQEALDRMLTERAETDEKIRNLEKLIEEEKSGEKE